MRFHPPRITTAKADKRRDRVAQGFGARRRACRNATPDLPSAVTAAPAIQRNASRNSPPSRAQLPLRVMTRGDSGTAHGVKAAQNGIGRAHRDKVALLYRDSIALCRDGIAGIRDRVAPFRDKAALQRDKVAPYRDKVACDSSEALAAKGWRALTPA